MLNIQGKLPFQRIRYGVMAYITINRWNFSVSFRLLLLCVPITRKNCLYSNYHKNQTLGMNDHSCVRYEEYLNSGRFQCIT